MRGQRAIQPPASTRLPSYSTAAWPGAATVGSPQNGLRLEVHTTEPGLQFYDAHKMAIPVPGLGGARYGARGGFCLEPQKFPDAVNKPHFTDTVVRPGQVYRQTSIFRFVA